MSIRRSDKELIAFAIACCQHERLHAESELTSEREADLIAVSYEKFEQEDPPIDSDDIGTGSAEWHRALEGRGFSAYERAVIGVVQWSRFADQILNEPKDGKEKDLGQGLW